MTNFPCFTCKSELLMPDGSIWCAITEKPVVRHSFIECPINLYEVGSATVYKPLPMEKLPKQKVSKIKVKEVKLKIIKTKPIKSSKKKTPPQIRLF